MAQSKAYDSNAGQWPRFSKFEALKPNSTEIRVLQLDIAREHDKNVEELRYNISYQELHEAPYCALSYSWGAPVPDPSQEEIFIEGESVLIRPTLYRFLQTLSIHDSSVRLWIDAVCINQLDTDERNQQIAMMADVFKYAQSIYVWLGVGDDDTNYAFEHIIDSEPLTPFDDRQYSPCVEKLFRASYWTRRWVLQEFALARELIIVCGKYVTTWSRMVEKVRDGVLKNDLRASQVFENFRQLKPLSTEQQLDLIQLMLRFRDARCIDRRDKAFALRGIASDGALLSPDYKESVADVYFRILSLLPTPKVLPEMTGYRWPHEAASQLQRCLLMNQEDIFGSLQCKRSDKLFATFEYVGEITSISASDPANRVESNPRLVEISQPCIGRLIGTEEMLVGDSVYSLQSSPRTPKGIFIVFRRKPTRSNPVAMAFGMDGVVEDTQDRECMKRIIVSGITECSRNSAAGSMERRAFCHISRAALIFLWLLDLGQEHHMYGFVRSSSEQRAWQCYACDCQDTVNSNSSPSSDKRSRFSESFEVLPPFKPSGTGSNANQNGTIEWRASEYDLFRCQDLDHLAPSEVVSESVPRQPTYYDQGRTDLSYAAEEGLMSWVKEILSMGKDNDATMDLQDTENRRKPLTWAVIGRQEAAIRLMLASDIFDQNATERLGMTPLIQAINGQFIPGVQLLLASKHVDANSVGITPSIPLSWAARTGNSEIVRMLIESGKVDLEKSDVDGNAPLHWASKGGHVEVTRLLLATKVLNVNIKDLGGRTPLAWAAIGGFADVVQLLLCEPSIEADEIDNQRWSPLRHAAHGNHVEVYRLLKATGKVEQRNIPVL